MSKMRYRVIIEDYEADHNSMEQTILYPEVINTEQKQEIDLVTLGKSKVTTITTIEIIETKIIDDPFAR